MRTCKRCKLGFLLCAVLFSQCVHSNFSLLKPVSQDRPSVQTADTTVPPLRQTPSSRPSDAPDSTPALPDSLDFAAVFADTPPSASAPALSPPADTQPVAQAVPDAVAVPTPLIRGEYPPFAMKSTMVRVLLKNNNTEAIAYTLGVLTAADGTRNTTVPDRGRLMIRADAGGVRISTIAGKTARFALPCTLLCADGGNIIEFESGGYRGGLILSVSRAGAFSVVNYLPVEEYLRGVVPLELGKRPLADIEALKAQAIAARTYTFARLVRTVDSTWDLLPTVADQVYGGVTAEYAASDQAIEQTAGVIMVWRNAPIAAYYHSTCGGKTAGIEDVWDKDPAPYLVSMDDRDRDGTPFCGASRLYNWKEHWTAGRLAVILKKFGGPHMRNGTFDGQLEGIRVASAFACGRIRTLRVSGSRGGADLGGDKVRFALRQDRTGNPILPSARFTVVRSSGTEIAIKGGGNGHGVGMCQMGALGRAQKKQGFEQILKAYYRGVELRGVVGE